MLGPEENIEEGSWTNVPQVRKTCGKKAPVSYLRPSALEADALVLTDPCWVTFSLDTMAVPERGVPRPEQPLHLGIRTAGPSNPHHLA